MNSLLFGRKSETKRKATKQERNESRTDEPAAEVVRFGSSQSAREGDLLLVVQFVHARAHVFFVLFSKRTQHTHAHTHTHTHTHTLIDFGAVGELSLSLFLSLSLSWECLPPPIKEFWGKNNKRIPKRIIFSEKAVSKKKATRFLQVHKKRRELSFGDRATQTPPPLHSTTTQIGEIKIKLKTETLKKNGKRERERERERDGEREREDKKTLNMTKKNHKQTQKTETETETETSTSQLLLCVFFDPNFFWGGGGHPEISHCVFVFGRCLSSHQFPRNR